MASIDPETQSRAQGGSVYREVDGPPQMDVVIDETQAELKRLEAENAGLRDIAVRIFESKFWYAHIAGFMACHYCGEEGHQRESDGRYVITHQSDCVIAQIMSALNLPKG